MRAVVLLLPLLISCDLLLPLGVVARRDGRGPGEEPLPDRTADSGESCVTTLAAGLDGPLGLAVDRDGTVLVAESRKHRIQRISGDGGLVPVAGSGVAGYLDAAPATAAQLDSPSDVALGGPGVVYIADSGNHVIRKLESGELHTHAGSNVAGFADGPVYTAKLQSPGGLAVDGWGVLYVADTDNNRIRRITAQSVASIGSTVTLPRAVAVDGVGTLFAVQDHRVVTLPGMGALAGGAEAGSLDGPADKARFHSPRGIVVLDGVVYLADRDNHRIRRIADGQVTTLAGSGSPGADDGTLLGATFNGPTALALDPLARRLFVADAGNGRVRALTCGLR